MKTENKDNLALIEESSAPEKFSRGGLSLLKKRNSIMFSVIKKTLLLHARKGTFQSIETHSFVISDAAKATTVRSEIGTITQMGRG